MKEPECVAGCKHFTGGEIKHHEDCPFYPESFSKMYNDLKIEVKKLRKFHCNDSSNRINMIDDEIKKIDEDLKRNWEDLRNESIHENIEGIKPFFKMIKKLNYIKIGLEIMKDRAIKNNNEN